jgi:hypothetical protein
MVMITSPLKDGQLTRPIAHVPLRDEQELFFVSPRDVGGGALRGEVRSVEFLTGCCLWSGPTALGVGADGERFTLVNPRHPVDRQVVALEIESAPSLYEVESATRLGGIISSIARNNPLAERVWLNVPGTEYKLYLFDAFFRGHISAEVMREWGAAVDARQQRVLELFQRHLPTTVGIEQIDTLRPIRGLVDDIVQGRRSLTPETLHEALEQLAEASPLWRDLIANDTPKDGLTKSWNMLSVASYSVAALAVSSERANPHRVVFAPDNRQEEKIYVLTEELARRLDQPVRLMALISHETMMVRRDDAAPAFENLYYVPQPRAGNAMELRNAEERA